MIDLDKVIACCVVATAAGLLVLSTYLVTIKTTGVDDWHDLAVNSQAAASQCLTVLEGVDAELISRRVR